MSLYPTELKKTQDRSIVIVWSDEVRHEIPYSALRKGCHCAHCNEERINPKPAPPSNQLNVLSAAEARPLDIEVMHPCLLYTSPSPRDATLSRMPSSA